ncbi:MAG: hypothetical protein EHM70_04760, partial [Chloroflexota bacterium]
VMLERREAVNRAMARFIETTSRSWSQAESSAAEAQRQLLSKERPWITQYDEGVPHTIAIPPVPLHNLLYSAARRFPGHTALIFEKYRLSYHRLEQEANRFANALRGLGLEKGDRVILFLPNMPQIVISFYGTLIAGGVAVFTLPTTEPAELIRQILESEAKVLVTSPNTTSSSPRSKTPWSRAAARPYSTSSSRTSAITCPYPGAWRCCSTAAKPGATCSIFPSTPASIYSPESSRDTAMRRPRSTSTPKTWQSSNTPAGPPPAQKA